MQNSHEALEYAVRIALTYSTFKSWKMEMMCDYSYHAVGACLLDNCLLVNSRLFVDIVLNSITLTKSFISPGMTLHHLLHYFVRM